MKKLLALILAAALALSLVACGGGGGTGDTNTPGTPSGGNGDISIGSGTPAQEETPPENNNKELSLYEPVTVGELQFAIMGTRFFVRGPLALEPLDGEADDGRDEVYMVVYFGIENVGQSEINVPQDIVKALDYNDGFMFKVNGTGTINGASWDGSNSYCTSSSTPSTTPWNLPPLSSPKYVAALFVVPREVMENENAPLTANIILDGTEFVYNIRPAIGDISPYDIQSEFIQDVQQQYDEAWLIRNISYCTELAYDDVAFAWKYVGNTNSDGKQRFADEYLDRLITPFTYIYENVPAERVAELFPETSALMNEIQTNIDALHARLVALGDGTEDTESIKNDAWAILELISNLADSEEIRIYGRFTSLSGRLNSI